MNFEQLPCEGGTTQSVAANDSAARIEAASPRSAEICLNKIQVGLMTRYRLSLN